MFSRVVASILLLMLALFSASCGAAEVSQSHQGLTLNANLELAGGKQLADGVILITHGGLESRDMAIIHNLQQGLADNGYSTLAINLSLGIDNRHGRYDCHVTHRHRNQDAADEIAAWVGWLKRQGARDIVVLGHSRGGAQTALYAAEHHDPAVKAVVLMAPATADNTSASTYQRRYDKPLAPILVKARKLVAAGRGDTVLHHVGLLNCRDSSATAASFVSYYGDPDQVDGPQLIKRISQPILVIVAGDDHVVVGLAGKLSKQSDGSHLRMKIVSGSGHLFRDLYLDDAIDDIVGFLKQQRV